MEDALPVSQCTSEICSFTRFDQVVTNAGRQGFCDLLSQCVAGSVLALAVRSAASLTADTYKAMIGVR